MTRGRPPSRCVTPQIPALIFAAFGDATEPDPVGDALRAAGVGTAIGDGLMRRAEFEDRIERACAGALAQDDEDFKEVARDPHIWEIRFKFSKRPYRLYIGEPPLAPAFVVGLHFHFKQIVKGDKAQTRALQNVEIDLAIARYRRGESSNWATLIT